MIICFMSSNEGYGIQVVVWASRSVTAQYAWLAIPTDSVPDVIDIYWLS